MRRAKIELTVMPSAGDIVTACLDAIPISLNEVTTLVEQGCPGGLELTQMRQCRLAKNLFTAVLGHLDDVRDTRLAAHLRDWIDTKPRLG
ncbi:hypothetical protein [Micromonospora gifhornensis]|nr:hypothetical protein [Micromonospora gifhornensis]